MNIKSAAPPLDPKKALIRAVITLATLDKQRQQGVLDAAGLACLEQAELVVSGRGGKIVADAFLAWIRNPVKHDPRGPTSVDTGERTPSAGAADGGRFGAPLGLKKIGG